MSTPSQFDILNGGRSVNIKNRAGLDETVNVKALPIRSMPQWMEAQTDEAKLVELATGKSAQWVDQLTPEAHVAILTAAEEVNSGFFDSWLARLKVRQERLAKTMAGT